MKKRIGLCLLIILALIELTLAGLLCYPRAGAQFLASRTLSRDVTIGDLQVTYHPCVLTLHDIHVKNAPWGSTPDMLQVGTIIAEPELKLLLTGTLRLRRLSVTDVKLLLERDANGTGNWKHGNRARPTPQEEAARTRRLPTALDVALKNTLILIRTTSGTTLSVALNDLRLHAEGENQPIALTVTGAYNDIPVQLDIAGQSFAALHDIHTPYKLHIAATGASSSDSADLSMMDPINFNQFTGTLSLNVKNTGDATALFGPRLAWNVPFTLQSGFERQGDHWVLADAHGNLAASRYMQSQIVLDEGSHQTPDAVKAHLHFEQLDIKSLEGPPPAHPQPFRPLTVTAREHPGTLLDAQLSADHVSYGALTASALALRARIAPGLMALEDISASLLGGTLHAGVSETTQDSAHHLHAHIQLKAQIAALASLAGGDSNAFAGPFETDGTVAASGDNTSQWAKSLQGALHFSMHQGHISRSLFRIASADLRRLLGADPASIPLACMNATLTFAQGIGTLSPFAVDTQEGTLLGTGTVNLPARSLDLKFKTNGKTTSSFAIDVPIHIVGALGNPHILPTSNARVIWQDNPTQTAYCN